MRGVKSQGLTSIAHTRKGSSLLAVLNQAGFIHLKLNGERSRERTAQTSFWLTGHPESGLTAVSFAPPMFISAVPAVRRCGFGSTFKLSARHSHVIP